MKGEAIIVIILESLNVYFETLIAFAEYCIVLSTAYKLLG